MIFCETSTLVSINQHWLYFAYIQQITFHFPFHIFIKRILTNCSKIKISHIKKLFLVSWKYSKCFFFDVFKWILFFSQCGAKKNSLRVFFCVSSKSTIKSLAEYLWLLNMNLFIVLPLVYISFVTFIIGCFIRKINN